ncbi:MAG TPA: TRAP transporter large permease subunit [Gammaproteobacteria bacterium]|nr:TRAP transporter large permease subunit [Gammaproteobacteria bacterium]
MALLVFLALLIVTLVGAPLFTVIGGSAMIGFHREGFDLSVVENFFGLAESSVLVSIPLFTFAGFLLSAGQAPKRLVSLSQALLGWLPGGLAMISLVTCALFTAFTGASGVTIIALGALLYPALAQAGYDERFNLGLITASGSLGLLFAPSLPLILYGVVAKAPIDDLFVAGALPGLLILVLLCVYSYTRSRNLPGNHRKASFAEVRRALLEARWDLPLPIIVLGGIYSGYFAVSEAAAVTALYVLIVEMFILRDVRWSALPGIMRESMVLVGAIFMILGMSLASTNYMIDTGVPQKLFAAVSPYIAGPNSFMVVLLVFLLILGTILDIFSATVLVVPLLLPIADRYGVNPIHLGIVFLAAMELGYLTPPVGLNLFIASHRFKKDISEIYLATQPFLIVSLIAVIIIAFWPGLSLMLLN